MRFTFTPFKIWAVCFLALAPFLSLAQVQDLSKINWYFGASQYGIKFNISDSQPNLVSDQNASYGQGGGAVATDQQTGDLLFYTDGNSVYDARHQQMPNGSGLSGDNALNQAAAISPRPNNPGQYFIFTNDAVGTIRYSIVDMAQGGNSAAPEPPLGDVTTKNSPTGVANSSPGMLVIETGNNPYQYWFLNQDITTGEINLYTISQAGLTLVKSVTPPNGIIAANFAYHPGTGKIAISPQNANQNIVLLDFNPLSNNLTVDRQIPNSAFNDGVGQSVYDVEFSPDGNALFISRFGGGAQPGVLYRYDLNNPTASLDPVATPAMYRSYGLQTAPDSSIYHLYQETNGGPILMGRINDPDSSVAQVNYQAAVLGNVDFKATQFPSFSPRSEVVQNAGPFDVVGTCFGTPTKFYPQLDKPADSYQWDFGDPANPDPPGTNRNPAPIHKYTQPGPYTVTLKVSTNGSDTTLTQTINIVQTDTVDLGQDTVICPGETLDLDAGPNGLVYRWNTGEAGQSITVDSAGYYWVVVDYGTCTSYDGINVDVYGEMNRRANVWYFGDQAGIDFNAQPPAPLTDGKTQAPAGVAGISDKNGKNLFYTDGNIIYDQDHNVMFNANAIGGDNNSTQSSIVVPFPNDETMFYVFTTKDIWGNPPPADHDYIFSYSVVDIKEIGNGTLGAVVAKDVPLFMNSDERIAAIQAGPGGGYWVLTHEFGNNTFRAYPITPNGIGQPVLTSIGSAHKIGPKEDGEGYMKFSPDGTKVAVALADPPNNYVELFDFDDKTGKLSNFIQVDMNAGDPSNSNYNVYGVEFASNSQKLFVTMNDQASPKGRLFELKLYDYVQDSIQKSVAQISDTPGVNYGAIQSGPDGQMYIAMQGESFVGQFQPNLDTIQTSSFNYASNRFDLAGKTSQLGLPNFVQNFTNQPSGPAASITAGCIGQPSTFMGTGTSIIDQYLWTFGDGGSDTKDQTEHTYAAPDTYTVSFNVSNRCGLDTTIVQDVTISGYPNEPTIPQVGVICDGALVLDADTTNTAGLTFQWNTGETTKTIQVLQPADYSVVVTNPAGCQSQDTTQVYDGRPQFDLGPNMTVCQNDSVMLDTGLPPGNPPNTFNWSVDGASISNNKRYLLVDTKTPGVFKYSVQVIDGLTNCRADDSVTVTINAKPTATYAVTQSSCGNPDGAINITSALTDLSINWTDGAGASLGSANPLSGIASDAYGLVVTSNISACASNYSINVTDVSPGFTINPTVTEACGGSTIGATLTPAVDGNFILTDENSNQQVASGPVSSGNISIPKVQPGSYTLLVTSTPGGCSDQQTGIVVNGLPTANLTVDPIFDLCSDNAVVTASSAPGATYSWKDKDGFVIGNTASVPVTESGIYTVTVGAAGVCDTTASTQVNLSNSPDATIKPQNNGCDGTRLVGVDVTPAGNYTYFWSTGETGPVIQINQSGDYDVTVRSQATGCQADTTAHVDVFAPFSVDVTADQIACKDGKAISLTATPSPVPQSPTYSWFLNDVKLRDTTATFQTFNEGQFRGVVTSNGCSFSGELGVNRAPVTLDSIKPEYIICPEPPANEVAVIEPGDFMTYQAFNLETGEQVFETSPGVFEIDEEGNYHFILTNTFGCDTQDTTFVNVDCVPRIYAPNAFSPNAKDPTNQAFKIYPTFVSQFDIFIYNRWGELIFHSGDLDFMTNQGWDGRKNGELLPAGTYAYVMRFKSTTEPDRGIIEQRGGVFLLR